MSAPLFAGRVLVFLITPPPAFATFIALLAARCSNTGTYSKRLSQESSRKIQMESSDPCPEARWTTRRR